MPLTPEMQAASAAPVALPFLAVEIGFPDGPVRLAASGVPVVFDGKTFLPEHPVYGTLSAIEGMDEEIGVMAPGLVISVLPPSISAIVALASPENQTADVSVWWGYLDKDTGQVIPTPELAFSGFWDRAVLRAGESVRVIDNEIVSAWERLFAGNEGQRLNAAWLQAQHPGDLGLDYVTGVEQHIPWGGDGPRPSVITTGASVARGGAGRGGSAGLVGS